MGHEKRKPRTVNAADLVAEARRRCLLARLLVELLVETVGESPGDDRISLLTYEVERVVDEACKAVESAREALR